MLPRRLRLLRSLVQRATRLDVMRLALSALATGCLSAGDLAHVDRADAAVIPADAAVQDALVVFPPAVDPSGDAAAPISLLDAGGFVVDDASYFPHDTSQDDAGDEPPRLACDALHVCAAEELCAPDGFCLPRCEAHGACVVVASARPIDQVWVLDEVTYLKFSSTHDGAGNDAHDAELRRLESNGDLTLLASHHEFEGLQSDGARLFWRSSNKIWRMPKEGSVAPEALYATVCDFLLIEQNQVALFDGFALALGSSDGQAPLRTLATIEVPAGGVTPAYVCSALAYAGQRVYWTRSSSTIVASSTTSEGELTLGSGAPDFLAVIPPYVYSSYWNTSKQVFRRDLRDLTQQMVTANLDPSAPLLRATGAVLQVHGKWVYRLSSSSAGESFYLDIERWSTTDLGAKQTIADGFRPPSAFPIVDSAGASIVSGPGASSFAVSSTHLFAIANHYPSQPIAAPESSLLYRLPLPSTP